MSEINGLAYFTDTSVNNGTVSTAVFSDTASNVGTVSVADFSGSAVNVGVVTQAAVFSGSASNTSNSVASATFSGSSSNTGEVATAVFTGNSTNTGVITGNAYFAGGAVNAGTVTGNAIFDDTSSNTGTVTGVASLAPTATNSGTVASSEVYVKNGYYTSGYYEAGTLTAPIVGLHLVVDKSGFYYYFPSSGSPVEAGAYMMYSFNSGAYWSTSQSLANGVVLYTTYTATFANIAANVSFADGNNTITTNANGVVTVVVVSNWYDDETGNHTMSFVNVPDPSTVYVNVGNGVKALYANGTGTCLRTDKNALVFGSADFTIEAWIKPAAGLAPGMGVNSGCGIISDLTTSSGNDVFALAMEPGALRVTSNLSGYTGAGSSISTVGEWYHVAATRQSGTVRLWVNGALNGTVDNADWDFTGSTSTYSLIGQLYPTEAQYSFYGLIGAVRIVKGTALYTQAFQVPNTTLANVSGTDLLLNFGSSNSPANAPAQPTGAGHTSGTYANGYFYYAPTGGSVNAYFIGTPSVTDSFTGTSVLQGFSGIIWSNGQPYTGTFDVLDEYSNNRTATITQGKMTDDAGGFFTVAHQNPSVPYYWQYI